MTSPLVPELVTEGDTLHDALQHVQDAVLAVVELYEDLGKALPASIRQPPRPTRSSLSMPWRCHDLP